MVHRSFEDPKVDLVGEEDWGSDGEGPSDLVQLSGL